MKRTITILLFASIALACCNDSSSSSSTYQEIPRSPEQLKMDLKQQEQNAPTDYLNADGTYKENFWGDKLKIQCEITNKATLAAFKDAVVRVTYYSKTETILAENDYTVYEIFQPNSSKTVEMKIDNYKDVNSVGWHIVSAKAVD
jgi:hypothetical protein